MLSKTTANKQYQAILGAVKQRAEDSGDVIDREGEFTVKRDFQATDGYESFTVRKGSHFDSDPETLDEVVIATNSDNGEYELRGFEQYRRTTLGLFKSDRLGVEVQQRDAFREAKGRMSVFLQDQRPIDESNYKYSPQA